MSRSTRSMRRWSTVVVAGGLSQAAALRSGHRAEDGCEYTAQIKKDLSDPRISTELVDHLPASDTVPTPLKFLGHISARRASSTTPRTSTATSKRSPRPPRTRAKCGRSARPRKAATWCCSRSPTRRRSRTSTSTRAISTQLTDPRKTTEAQARQLIKTAKPIYYVTSGMHSPETGGPEMLMELAYRLAVEETPFIQNIRNNVITIITPVIEVDGREKYVDNYYFNEKWSKDHGAAGSRRRTWRRRCR